MEAEEGFMGLEIDGRRFYTMYPCFEPIHASFEQNGALRRDERVQIDGSRIDFGSRTTAGVQG